MTITKFTKFDLYVFSEIMQWQATLVTDNNFTWNSVTRKMLL